MTLTSAAVRRPAPRNEPLHGIVVAVLGNPLSKCNWRVKQIGSGDFEITFCYHPEGVLRGARASHSTSVKGW